jgi:ABC-2 type transport system ATP-binding protein
MLELDDVSKSYHGVPAVRGLTLRALPGQVIGLLGPNGSGKTTTVRMMVGLLGPSRGSIRWNGDDIHHDLQAYQAIVGYVPEEPKLYTYLTAIEHLELVGGLRNIPRRELARRIERYMELLQLDTDRHAPLSSFSKGMRQKVLLASALLHDPAVLVLDEPNSGLDVMFALVLRTVVDRLKSRGKVIVYSSHVLEAVERVCDDVVILHKSHVVARGSVSRLRSLTATGTLEEAFATVAVDQDPARLGCELADVAVM